MYILLQGIAAYLEAGLRKTSFGSETDRLLAKLTHHEREEQIKSFQEVFQLAHQKLEGHLQKHPAFLFYEAARIFDPCQLPTVSHDITDYSIIKGFENPSPELLEEFLIYCRSTIDSLPNSFVLSDYWTSVTVSSQFPLLSSVAKRAIWMPVTSVDVERSFSQYKHFLNDRRGLTEENTKRLLMLYHNGDIQGRFN